MMQPAVSVIIPTYNRAAYLPRALDSVIAQTWRDWEIVLIDDGSTDDTSRVAEAYARQLGSRLIFLQQGNHGASHARNCGIEASSGRFIAFLDSDDEFVPAKLERQLELFSLCPDLGLVYCDYAFVDLNGTRHDSAFASKCAHARSVTAEQVGVWQYRCNHSLFDRLLEKYFIATIVGMMRRELLGSNVRFHESLRYAEEWLFYLQLARCAPAGFVDEPLCVHHFVAGSLARSDKEANFVELAATVHAMAATLSDLTPAQQRVLHTHLADTYRQLGYDAHRAGRFSDATAAFVRSLRCLPRVKVLAAAGDAFWRGLLRSHPAPATKEPVGAQAVFPGVR